MNSLTICYITARKEPEIPWFMWSLEKQIKPSDKIAVIVVDLHWIGASPRQIKDPGIRDQSLTGTAFQNCDLAITTPKPTVWQGPHRLTKEDWWAISNARNTGTCLCQTEWIAFVDDRCVLAPTWLQAVRDAMEGNYAVAGSYEKRSGMKVEAGKIVVPGEIIGVDFRNPQRKDLPPRKTYGSEWYGCTSAMPLEWVLEQNGHDERFDSMGLEDVVFGSRLAQNGRVTVFDTRMKIIEDRSSEHCRDMPKRTDKGISPNDRSHAMLEKFGQGKRAEHPFDIREVRRRALAGEPWPPPWGPVCDFWDNEPLGEMTVR